MSNNAYAFWLPPMSSPQYAELCTGPYGFVMILVAGIGIGLVVAALLVVFCLK